LLIIVLAVIQSFILVSAALNSLQSLPVLRIAHIMHTTHREYLSHEVVTIDTVSVKD